jgi:ribosomal protein S18 acetylase RimI-like enzyme
MMLEVNEVRTKKMLGRECDVLDGHHLFFVADKSSIGHVMVNHEQWHSDSEAWAYVTSVEIDERYRGMGHGKQMMKEVVEFIREHEYAIAYLYVDARNRAAVHVYESVGFKPVSKSQGTLVMVCRLDGGESWSEKWSRIM